MASFQNLKTGPRIPNILNRFTRQTRPRNFTLAETWGLKEEGRGGAREQKKDEPELLEDITYFSVCLKLATGTLFPCGPKGQPVVTG